MPASLPANTNANSLWRPGARSFFKDQRARTRGDIVTVVIDIDDRARLNNSTERTRDNGESAAIPAFGGLEQRLADLLLIFLQILLYAAKATLIAAKMSNLQ